MTSTQRSLKQKRVLKYVRVFSDLKINLTKQTNEHTACTQISPNVHMVIILTAAKEIRMRNSYYFNQTVIKVGQTSAQVLKRATH